MTPLRDLCLEKVNILPKKVQKVDGLEYERATLVGGCEEGALAFGGFG